jgi:hypothetical protein
MRKLALSLTAAAIGAAVLALAGHAEAGTLAGADSIRAALDGVSITENVHCTPGYVHRRAPPYDGCWRRAYYAPAYRYAYPYGGSPYRYGWGGGPGVGIGIGVGPYGYWGGPRVGIGFGVGPYGHWGGPRVGVGFGWGW